MRTKATIKLNSAIKMWLTTHKADGKSAITLKNYKSWLGVFSDWFAKSDFRGQDPTPEAILAFKEYCASSGRTPNTIRQYLTVLNMFFTFWHDPNMKYSYDNPVLKEFLPKKKNNNKPYDEFLTTEEVIKVLSKPYPKSRANLGIRNRAIVILMITTGIRKSELTALKLNNVDFFNKRIYIMGGKGDKFRVVALPDLAIEALKEYLDSGVRPANVADDDFLFGSMYTMNRGGTDKPQTWKGLADSQPYKIVIKYIEAKTGKTVRPHDLRHVYSRLLLQNGASMEEIQSMLGHSNVKTTQIYTGKLLLPTENSTAFKVFADMGAAAGC